MRYMLIISYSRKYYWQSLNMVVRPQTKCNKYWRNINLTVVLPNITSLSRKMDHIAREQ